MSELSPARLESSTTGSNTSCVTACVTEDSLFLSRLVKERDWGFTAATPWGFALRVGPETLAIYSQCCRAALGSYDRQIHCCRRCGEPVALSLDLLQATTVEAEQAFLEAVLGFVTELPPLELVLLAAELRAAVGDERARWWKPGTEDPHERPTRQLMEAWGGSR